MSNLRLIAFNDSDDATLSASSADIDVDNLQRIGRSRVWRAASDTGENIKGDWSSAITVSGVALWRHNLTASGTWRVRLWDATGQSGTLLYDSGTVDAWSGFDFADWDFAFARVWPNSITGVRSIQIDLDDSGNPDGFVQASRLIVGDVFEPATGIQFGASLRWSQNTQQTRTAGGTLRATPSASYRVIEADLDFLKDAERETLLAIQRRVGKTGEVFVSGRHDSTDSDTERDWTVLVKITETSPVVSAIPLLHNTRLRLAET